MLLATLVALLSVSLGAALALAPRRGTPLGAIRTFALAASLAVVLTHLLPEALEELGARALLAFAAGVVAPGLLESLLGLFRRQSAQPDKPARRALRLELGFIGLLVHSFGDGLGLGAFTGPGHAGHSHPDVLLALSAHTVPVVAMVVLTFAELSGRKAGLWRAGYLALATLFGVLATHFGNLSTLGTSHAWLVSGVAGLLLHVVLHDLRAYPPHGTRARAIDLAALAAGLSVSLLDDPNSHHHGSASGSASADLGHAFLRLWLETAPLLLFGLLAGAAIQVFGRGLPERWLKPLGAFSDAARGALIGAPLPLWSCSVLPVSRALQRRRASAALVVAFLIATPGLGVETFMLSVRFLNWPFAWLRLGGALLVAVIAALLVSAVNSRVPPLPDAAAALPAAGTPSLSGLWRAFDELLDHVGVWMVSGLLVAAMVEAWLPAGPLHTAPPLLELLVMTAVTIPSYVCAPSAIPLAAVLIERGVSPGAVLVGLLLGPATNLVTLAFLRRSFGTRATLLGLLGILGAGWGLALVANPLLGSLSVRSSIGGESHAGSGVAWTAAVLLGALLLRSIFRDGVRGWLGSIFGSGDGHHHHSHDHDHH